MANPRKTSPSEHQIQSTFCEWLDKSGYQNDYFAVPNAARRSPRHGAYMKEEGLRAGVPDLFITIGVHGSHGLFLEFKTQKGRLTESQRERINLLTLRGYSCEVVRSVEEAIDAFKCYLNPPPMETAKDL